MSDLTKEKAVELIKANAKDYDYCDGANTPRRAIHSFIGNLGCDWDEADVIALIEKSDRVGWVSGFFDHDLVVYSKDGLVCFKVKQPGTL